MRVVGGGDGHHLDAIGTGGFGGEEAPIVGIAAGGIEAELGAEGLSARGIDVEGPGEEGEAAIAARGGAVRIADLAAASPPTSPQRRGRGRMGVPSIMICPPVQRRFTPPKGAGQGPGNLAPHPALPLGSRGVELMNLTRKRILVVEDDRAAGEALCAELRDAGAIALGPAPTTFYALQLLGRRGIDAAVLDTELHARRSTNSPMSSSGAARRSSLPLPTAPRTCRRALRISRA